MHRPQQRARQVRRGRSFDRQHHQLLHPVRHSTLRVNQLRAVRNQPFDQSVGQPQPHESKPLLMRTSATHLHDRRSQTTICHSIPPCNSRSDTHESQQSSKIHSHSVPCQAAQSAMRKQILNDNDLICCGAFEQLCERVDMSERESAVLCIAIDAFDVAHVR